MRAQQNEGAGRKRGNSNSGKDWLKNQRERQKQLLAAIDALLPAQAKTKQVKGVGSRSCGSSGRSMFTILQDTISLIRELKDKGHALHPAENSLQKQPASSGVPWKEALLESRSCMIFETEIPNLIIRDMSVAAKQFCGSLSGQREASLYSMVAKDEVDTLRFFIEQSMTGGSSLSKLLRVKRIENAHVKQEGSGNQSGFDFLQFRVLWISLSSSSFTSSPSAIIEAVYPNTTSHHIKPNVRKDRKTLAFRLDRLLPIDFKSQQAKGVGSRAYGDQGRSLLTILQDSITWIKRLQQEEGRRRCVLRPQETSLHHQILISSVTSMFLCVKGSRLTICEVSRGAAGLFEEQASQLIDLSLVDLVRPQDRGVFFAFVKAEAIGRSSPPIFFKRSTDWEVEDGPVLFLCCSLRVLYRGHNGEDGASLVLELNREKQMPTLVACDAGAVMPGSPESPQTSQALVLSSVSRPLQASLHLELPDMGQRPEAASLRLSQTVMRGVWEAGYSVTGLAKMFNELPASVRSVLDKGLWSMEQIFRHNAQNQQALVRRREAPGDNMKLITSLLMKDENIGFWNMDINTETLRRTKLEISPGIANLLNMHPDEMLARVGNKDTELPNSDLEFFCTIIYDIISVHHDRMTRYSRLLRRCPRTGKLIDPFLVRVHSIKERNEEGRVFRMWHILERVTPEEYDEARRKNPQICRPLLEQMGDCRGAEELLESANYDNLFNQSFQFMKTTAEGQQQLQALTNAVRECFAPFVAAADRLAQATGDHQLPR